MRSDYPKIIGKIVTVEIERPSGSCHPEYPDLVYPINYGFVPGLLAEDGEEQDAYILGLDGPVEKTEGKVIAVWRRENDAEDKWIVSANMQNFDDEQILKQIDFQERFFKGKLLR